MFTRPWPHVDEVVGRPHHVLVVLHHQHGVTDVAQALEGGDELAVVALVQPDGRLVQDVEHPYQAGADLRGQTDPLRLATRQRARATREREIPHPHVDEEFEARADLGHGPLGDERLGVGQFNRLQEAQRTFDGVLGEVVDVGATHGDGQRRGLEPGAIARVARRGRHVLLDAVAYQVAAALGVAAPHLRDDALEPGAARVPAAAALAQVEPLGLALRAAQQHLLVVLRQVLPPHVHGDVPVGACRPKQQVVEVGGAVGPRQDGAALKGLLGVDHQFGVNLGHEAQTGALLAGALRRVEREDARRQFGQRRAVLGARELLAVGPGALVAAHLLQAHQPVGEARGRLEALGEATPKIAAHHQAVNHHLHRVALVLLERRHLVNAVHLAIHAHAGKALVADVLDDVLLLALALAHHRRQHHEARALVERQHPVGDLLHALPGDLHPALGAVRNTDARVEHAQVVVDLGDGGNRRPRVAAGGLLVDRDGRGQPLDVVHVGLVHLPQELPGVRGEALHVAALPLGVQRVEREARLAAARQARDHREPVTRDLGGHVLEVVLTGTDDTNGVHAGHCNPRTPRPGLRTCTT